MNCTNCTKVMQKLCKRETEVHGNIDEFQEFFTLSAGFFCPPVCYLEIQGTLSLFGANISRNHQLANKKLPM